ncbi:hypothetical protein FIBSPDRAFT_946677 [Athelia psychrophila]|uniref:Uncharacterized protein n=1 Tax=Athelia psychrophila TaxID=1759441 RepID=A0A166STF4_9AGAM|nr:hypothetical protein FIBSPDRAFT_946677 [Fibularhizoctonia sp. CBS 109695]
MNRPICAKHTNYRVAAYEPLIRNALEERNYLHRIVARLSALSALISVSTINLSASTVRASLLALKSAYSFLLGSALISVSTINLSASTVRASLLALKSAYSFLLGGRNMPT